MPHVRGANLSSPARTGLAWVLEGPSGQLAPRGGTVNGLAVERLSTGEGGLTDSASLFAVLRQGNLAIQR